MEYLIFFVVLLVLGVTLFTSFRRYNPPPPTLPPEFIRWKKEAQDIILEIEKVGKEVTENVEEKIKILRKVMKEAEDKSRELDRKIEHLSRISIKIPTRYEDEVSILPPRELEENIFSPPPQNRYAKIHHLYEQGWDISEIAKEVNVGKGEVQLILDLKKEMKG